MKKGLKILETELRSTHSLSVRAGQLQADCPEGGEKMNLPRYLDSIVDCNRATCSQRVYAKIFIYYKYILLLLSPALLPLYLLSK